MCYSGQLTSFTLMIEPNFAYNSPINTVPQFLWKLLALFFQYDKGFELLILINKIVIMG